MEQIRIFELAEIDEDAYASEKAKGLFVQAGVHIKQLEKLFADESFLYKQTKAAGGDTREFELVAKSIEHLKATIEHAEQAAQLPDVSNRRDRSGW